MSKKKKKTQSGFTKQGIKDLSYLKGKSVGIRLEMPPTVGSDCQHPTHLMDYDHQSGVSRCRGCSSLFDFDGRFIR